MPTRHTLLLFGYISNKHFFVLSNQAPIVINKGIPIILMTKWRIFSFISSPNWVLAYSIYDKLSLFYACPFLWVIFISKFTFHIIASKNGFDEHTTFKHVVVISHLKTKNLDIREITKSFCWVMYSWDVVFARKLETLSWRNET